MSQNVTKVKKPYKERIARLYAIWRSIPAALRIMSRNHVKELGYTDEEFLGLLECNFRQDFARRYGVSRKELQRWDNSETIQGWINDINKESNILRFKKDIDFAFTRKTIREADAARVKLWKQLFEDWREKSEMDMSEKTREALKKIQDDTRALIEQEKRKHKNY